MNEVVAEYIKSKWKHSLICVRNEKEDDECLEFLTALGCKWCGDGKKPNEWKPRNFISGFAYPCTFYPGDAMTWNVGCRKGAVEWSEIIKNAVEG